MEVTKLTNTVGIRDSKNKVGSALVVPTAAWSAFIGMVRTDDVGSSVVE